MAIKNKKNKLKKKKQLNKKKKKNFIITNVET